MNLLMKLIGKNFKQVDFFDTLVFCVFNKLTEVTSLLALVIYLAFSVVPYYNNLKDEYLIESYNKNISLYDNYLKEYTESAQKQIEEYQANQSRMARTASTVQLQFWSSQVDSVGNSITEKIKEFNRLKLDQQLEINKAESRMNSRKNNKFYFWKSRIDYL